MRSLIARCLGVAIAASAGCQLAVEFDRSRLGEEAPADAGAKIDEDASIDAALDAKTGDANTEAGASSGNESLDAETPDGG